MTAPLDAFREAYKNLDLLPLRNATELARFRVDYGREAIAELEQLVEDDDSCSGKTIFAGHRGRGRPRHHQATPQVQLRRAQRLEPATAHRWSPSGGDGHPD